MIRFGRSQSSTRPGHGPDAPQPDRVAALADLLIRRRFAAIAASLALAGAVGSGVRFLEFDADYRAFFSPDNPQLAAFDQVENVYAKTDRTLIVLAPRDGVVFSRESLALIHDVTARAWKLPFTTRVDSVTNFQDTRAEGDLLLVDDLVPDPARLTDEELARVRRVALDDPQLVGMLVSRRGHVAAVSASHQLPGQAKDEVGQVAAAVRALADEVRRSHPGVEVRLTGDVLFNHSFNEAGERDGRTLTPLMFVVLLGATYLVLRSVAATVAAFVVIVLSALTALGAAGWLGIPLTSMSVQAPNMILTIAVADAIHVLVSLMSGLRAGSGRTSAISAALRENFRPELLTAVTTVVGFLTMNLADSPPLRDLGNVTAIGIVAAFLLTVFLLPALMAVLPLRVRPRASRSDVRLTGLADFVLRRRHALLAAAAGMVLVLGGGVFLNEVNDEFIKYFDERFPIRPDTDFIVDNLTGMYKVEFSLGAGGAGAIADPEYLQRLAAFADWWRAQPEALYVGTFSDVMKRLNCSMHGDDPAWYRLPEDRQAAAQYLLLYEMSLPPGQDLNDRIDVDKSSTRFIVNIRSIKTGEIRALAGRAEAWLRDHAPPHMFGHATGAPIMFAHIFDRNIWGVLSGTLLGVVVIGAVMAATLRSLRYGLLSLLLNATPAVLGFGVWGLLEGRMSFAISVVAAMTLGIVDDATVHWMTRYLSARRAGAAAERAVRDAFGSVGKATLANAFILIAGFFVMSWSGFRMNSDMAGLTALTIFLALVANLLFLPPLLATLDGRRPQPSGVVGEAVA